MHYYYKSEFNFSHVVLLVHETANNYANVNRLSAVLDFCIQSAETKSDS